MGYYFLQSQIQRGNYLAKFVANEFLQTGLDTGIIPLLIITGIVLKTLVLKKTNGRDDCVIDIKYAQLV